MTDEEKAKLREPIFNASVPVALHFRPGQPHSFIHMTGSTAEITEGEGEDKKHVGDISFCIGGIGIEINITENGRDWTYWVRSVDLWKSVFVVHESRLKGEKANGETN